MKPLRTKTAEYHNNYYQYNAATAGTGGTITSANAASSICPKGWTLPRSGNQAGTLSLDNNNGTFANLLRAYGVNSKLSSAAGTVNITQRNYSVKLAGNNSIDLGNKEYTLTADQFNIAGSPLSFVRSGLVNLYYGYVRFAGISSYYWSRSAYSNTSYAYGLGFNSSAVYPSNNVNVRYYGFSLRCLQE